MRVIHRDVDKLNIKLIYFTHPGSIKIKREYTEVIIKGMVSLDCDWYHSRILTWNFNKIEIQMNYLFGLAVADLGRFHIQRKIYFASEPAATNIMLAILIIEHRVDLICVVVPWWKNLESLEYPVIHDAPSVVGHIHPFHRRICSDQQPAVAVAFSFAQSTASAWVKTDGDDACKLFIINERELLRYQQQ